VKGEIEVGGRGIEREGLVRVRVRNRVRARQDKRRQGKTRQKKTR
jgi:hypothetical protein